MSENVENRRDNNAPMPQPVRNPHEEPDAENDQADIVSTEEPSPPGFEHMR